MDFSTSDQQRARINKLTELRNLDIDPYPPEFNRTHSSEDLIRSRTELLDKNEKVTYAGRVVRINRKGKIAFVHLKDEHGRIQAVLSKSETDGYTLLRFVDLGDWLGVEGSMFLTNSGEYSVRASAFTLLSKAMRPLPIPKEKLAEDSEKQVFDLLRDTETRYRQRYVDLAVNDDVRAVFRQRSAIVAAMRRYLDSLGYLEVETPVLQPVYGGANARPFKTHHFAQNMPVYLRISNELYLKRCIIGGFEKVYEFARDFRNEGIDRTHNPEFTILEFYEAYADYRVMMDRIEELVISAAESVVPDLTVSVQGERIDLKSPWIRISMYDSIREYVGVDPVAATVDELIGIVDSENTGPGGSDLAGTETETEPETEPEEANPSWTRGELLIELFERKVAPRLIQPHIIYDYPKEASPLCRPHRSDPELVEQFELYIAGVELCTAYTELIDPQMQRDAFERQAESGRGKDSERHPVDEDFIFVLESGMPPTGGVGIGIDRLVMLLTGSASVRDVLLFPLMKPDVPGGNVRREL